MPSRTDAAGRHTKAFDIIFRKYSTSDINNIYVSKCLVALKISLTVLRGLGLKLVSPTPGSAIGVYIRDPT